MFFYRKFGIVYWTETGCVKREGGSGSDSGGGGGGGDGGSDRPTGGGDSGGGGRGGGGGGDREPRTKRAPKQKEDSIPPFLSFVTCPQEMGVICLDWEDDGDEPDYEPDGEPDYYYQYHDNPDNRDDRNNRDNEDKDIAWDKDGDTDNSTDEDATG